MTGNMPLEEKGFLAVLQRGSDDEADTAAPEVGGVLDGRILRDEQVVGLDEDGRARQQLVGQLLLRHRGEGQERDLVAALADAVEILV